MANQEANAARAKARRVAQRGKQLVHGTKLQVTTENGKKVLRPEQGGPKFPKTALVARIAVAERNLAEQDEKIAEMQEIRDTAATQLAEMQAACDEAEE